MKVVFLDFDGVLNSWPYLVPLRQHQEEVWATGGTLWNQDDLDPKAIKAVDEICRRTGAKVVISSSWRILYPLSDLRGWLAERGLTAEVIDKTVRQSHLGPERGHEIQEWLDANPAESFVIIDDSSDMAHLMPRLFRTSMETGLLPEHVDPIVKMLREYE